MFYQIAMAMGSMLMTVFPGRVLWLSYPVLNILSSDPTVNDLIVKVNKMVRDGVRKVDNPRLAYLNLAPLQLEHLQQYSDVIHHPGSLSEMIIRLIANMLNP